MKDYELKDKILSYMVKGHVINTCEMSEAIDVEHGRCLKLLKKMRSEQFIKVLEPETDYSINYVARISSIGEVFINDGGYTKLYMEERKNRRSKSGYSLVTGILIPLFTLGIAAWQVILTNRTNELEDKNKQLQAQVDSLIRAIPEKARPIDTSGAK